MPPVVPPPRNDETYEGLPENAFGTVSASPLSTFSIDVDTASYSNLRRFLNEGTKPPADAVRVEELVNYFPYAYAPPQADAPFSVNVEVAGCPWNEKHKLARIGLKGREIEAAKLPPSNLVFLLDVSGSMQDGNKLPLVKQALRLLVGQLRPDDRIAIVTYSSGTGVAMESTKCTQDNKPKILSLIEGLQAGGSTNGAGGLQLAYETALKNFVHKGTNRVILTTDGDFNVGITNTDELVAFIQKQAAEGIFLSVLGFGMGNLKDARLEQLADKGNGLYGYVDNVTEARKLFLEQMAGSLVTIAKDVKIQVEFNPLRVAGYRLLGYENRMLKAEDFNDDKKDAGEIGAGHTVTALYEIVPAGQEVPGTNVDALKYQAVQPSEQAMTNELFTVKLRYKPPREDESKLLAVPVKNSNAAFESASEDFRFAAGVAAFGQLLRESKFTGDMTFDRVIEIAQNSRGTDEFGYRAEFVSLVRNAKALIPVKSTTEVDGKSSAR
jgi:Ca-activated chloride channel family protein